MNIALIGYGKMGKTIRRIAESRGHKVVCIIDKDNAADIGSEAFRSADVAIEFTQPDAAAKNCSLSLRCGVKVVSGSTGWADNLAAVEDLCRSLPETSMLWSSNFSIGVNLFFYINMYTVKLMEKVGGYTPSIHEIHHIHKLDHPSGTAITLAEQVIKSDGKLSGWSEEPVDNTLLITHQREGEVPGTHIVRWDGAVDELSLTHRAKSREGFALGAVMAAEWIKDCVGPQTMEGFMKHLVGKMA